MCGGTVTAAQHCCAQRGLSPRVRGNQRVGVTRLQHPRSIPACAGEPLSLYWYNNGGKVYPRVCGGTEASDDFCQ